MTNVRKRGYRTFTVSFPPELAELVDEMAEREHRQLSELFREAFRCYAGIPSRTGVAGSGGNAGVEQPSPSRSKGGRELPTSVPGQKRAAS